MSTKPLVTILMPAYNHANFVKEAIESLIEQDYENIEFYIINDGSTDNTHEVISKLFDKCKRRFTNFEYIHRPNKGLIPTLKELEQFITGEYMSLLYSDDIYTKERIQIQINELIQNKDYAMCYGNMLGIDETSKVVKKYKNKHKKSGYIFNDLMLRNIVTAPTVMMRTNVFKSVGGYDLNFDYDDYPLWLKIAHTHKILYLDEYLVFYRMHGNNVSSDILRTIALSEKVLLSWKKEKIFKRAIKRFNLLSFYNLAKYPKEYKDKTYEYMIKSLPHSWYDPRFIKSVFRYYFL